jgi:exodeoxyribonuclease VII small subunit
MKRERGEREEREEPSAPDAGAAEAIGFTAAIRELEEILAGIEGEEVDLDRLADELRRASELLELCRSKIRKAEIEVSQIVQKLESEG